MDPSISNSSDYGSFRDSGTTPIPRQDSSSSSSSQQRRRKLHALLVASPGRRVFRAVKCLLQQGNHNNNNNKRAWPNDRATSRSGCRNDNQDDEKEEDDEDDPCLSHMEQGQVRAEDWNQCRDNDDDNDNFSDDANEFCNLNKSNNNNNSHNNTTNTAKYYWGKLATDVVTGHALLRHATGQPGDTRQPSASPHFANKNDNDDEPSSPRTWDSMNVHEREQQRIQAQDRIRQGMEFTLTQCLVAMLIYVGVAVLAFSICFDHWTVIDSIYFAVVTFTTIGYGDVVPDTFVTQVFTLVYAVSGVACLGIAMGVLGARVVQAQERALRTTSQLAKTRVMSLFAAPAETDDWEHAMDESMHQVTQEEEKRAHPFAQMAQTFALVLLILVLFALCVSTDPGFNDQDEYYSFFDALYYTVITATTVGYGDYAPKTQRGRFLAIVFIPLAVGAMGHFLSIVATVIMDSRRRQSLQRHWGGGNASQQQQHELSWHDLELMDADGDGHVTRAEFLEFMLLSMGKVDRDLMEELRQYFGRLDTAGTGYLSKDDLLANARQKLQQWDKKLELAAYKDQLLQRARAARDPRNAGRGASVWSARLSFFNNNNSNTAPPL